MKNKVAIITGSTQGLGEGIARVLISRGLSELVICGRNTENGNRLAKEFNQLGCKTVYVEADLSKVDDCYKIVDTAKNKFGRVDILVNSAGTTDRGYLINTTPELYDYIMNVNARAPFLLMQGVVKIMINNDTAGTILNISSMSSHGGQPFLAAYSMSKSALDCLTKNTAWALMQKHIRVNSLNIGWTDTPGEHKIQKEYHKSPDNWLEKVEAEQPYHRIIKPEEVGKVAAFLLSDDSGIMSGVLIDYDQSVIGAHYIPERPKE